MYSQIEPAETVQFGEHQTGPAVMSFSDGDGKIHCLLDDHCYVFISEGTHKPLQWIPSEVVEGLTTAYRTADLQRHESSSQDRVAVAQ